MAEDTAKPIRLLNFVSEEQVICLFSIETLVL